MVNARFFSNTAQQTTLSGSISAGATSVTVAATTGFPTSYPYTVALDYGGAAEELVDVTAAAATTLTVVRGYGGTSAQSHSLGAVVRHVYDATEAAAFRTHEAATAAVHGVSGTLVGTSDTQTLANKTLTSPTINGVTWSGTASGTLAGSPTFSGNVVFSGQPVISDLTNATHTHESAAKGGSTLKSPTLTSTGTGAVSLLVQQVAGQTADTVKVQNSAAADLVRVLAGGVVATTPTTTVLTDYLSVNAPSGANASSVLLGLYQNSVQQFAIGLNGQIISKQVLFARKTVDTSRASTTTLSDDPHLTFTVEANTTYIIEGWIKYSATSAADITVAWKVPAGALGEWSGRGNGLSVTSADTSGYGQRSESNDITQTRNFGGVSGSNFATLLIGTLRVQGTGGTFALQWTQGASDASGTVVYTDSWIKLTRVA